MDVIEEHATEVLMTRLETEEYTKSPKSPVALDKKLVRKFSFTRSVTRDVYKRTISKTSLHDGATPIMVVDDPNPNQVELMMDDDSCNSR